MLASSLTTATRRLANKQHVQTHLEDRKQVPKVCALGGFCEV